MASIFSSSSYPTQQVEVYEQSYGDEYVSLEQNFQSNWNAFSEDTSEITKSVSIRACIVIFIFCKCYRSNCNAGRLHFSVTYFPCELNVPAYAYFLAKRSLSARTYCWKQTLSHIVYCCYCYCRQL
uniref:Uncharacterized protein n=1 Tax=Aegilops tauschii subsp. strangulata TaxID=200361 RepID=A0A453ANA2_AEGTS